MSLVLVAWGILTVGTSQASADTNTDPEQAPPPLKSSGLALGLSSGLPAAGYAMILVSSLPSGNIQTWQNVGLFTGVSLALVGPSVGHFYTGQVGRGLAFSAGRLVLSILGAMALGEGIARGDVSEADYDKGAVRTATIEIALCGAGILGLSIWEAIDTYDSTVALKRAARPDMAVTPLLMQSHQGLSVAGLALAGRY